MVVVLPEPFGPRYPKFSPLSIRKLTFLRASTDWPEKMAAFVVLGLNGMDLHASEESMVSIMLDLSAGELEEEALALWLKENSSPMRSGDES